MAEVNFRSYQESDAEVLPGLFLQAIQSVYPDLQDGPWLDGLRSIDSTYIETGGDFIVGEHQEAVVAMGGIKRVNETTGEMIRVAVAPDSQGFGLGQALLEAIETRAKDLGMQKLILDTTLGQSAARHLYDKNGYKLVDRQKVPHPTGNEFDTFYYEKEIAKPKDIISLDDFRAVHNHRGAGTMYYKLWRDVVEGRVPDLSVLEEERSDPKSPPRLTGDVAAAIQQQLRLQKTDRALVLERVMQKQEADRIEAELSKSQHIPRWKTESFEREGFTGRVYVPKEAELGFNALAISVFGRHSKKRILDGNTRTYFVTDGRGTFTLNGKLRSVSKGDFFVIASNSDYEYEGDMELFEVNISPDNSFGDEKLE